MPPTEPSLPGSVMLLSITLVVALIRLTPELVWIATWRELGSAAI